MGACIKLRRASNSADRLQAVRYDPVQLPDLNFAMPPDAKFGGGATLHDPNSTSHTFSDLPEQIKIACCTDIYFRQNQLYSQGDQSSSRTLFYWPSKATRGLVKAEDAGFTTGRDFLSER